MKRYEKYKPTGIQWLPEIPEHWNIMQLRKYLSLVSIKGKGDKQLLSVTREKGVIKRDIYNLEENHNFVPEDLNGYKYVTPGQFVINKMKSWQGSYGVSDYEGIVSPAYFICNLNFPNKEFFSQAIRSRAYVDFFAQWSKGIRVGQWDLEPIALKSIPFFEPPILEQNKIVAYLDKRISLIENCKCQRERELQTLNELKQAEIASVVTRGLNPDVPMVYMDTPLKTKHPSHWKRVRNMTFLIEQTEKVGKQADDYQLLSLTTNGIIVRDVESGKGKFPKDFESYKVVEPGELVFCLFDIDETPRTIGLSQNHGMITGAYDVFKVKEDIVNPSFVYAFYLVIDNIKALKPYYSGLRKVVKHNRFMQIGFALPPIEEQNAIVEYIESKTNKIDTMIEALKAEIDRLTEYKQRLISDVVTGQIDVRGEQI